MKDTQGELQRTAAIGCLSYIVVESRDDTVLVEKQPNTIVEGMRTHAYDAHRTNLEH